MNKEAKINFMEREDIEFDTSIPTAPINFEEFHPANIDVWDEYKPIRDEVDRVTKAILKAKFPYLIESEKGQGKTLLIHTICKKNNIALIEEPVGSGTKKSDLIGSKEINRDGTLFNLGMLPKAIEVANHYKHACLYGDDASPQDHAMQRWWNSICDGRRSVVANGKRYRLNEGCKLAIIWTINPSTYAGLNSMTEDLSSRFIGNIWDYPSKVEMEDVVDWSLISVDLVKEPLLTLVQDIYALKRSGQIDYALSTRDVVQFVEHYRDCVSDDVSKPLETVIQEIILIKYTDPEERELVKIRANDTFGVNV